MISNAYDKSHLIKRIFNQVAIGLSKFKHLQVCISQKNRNSLQYDMVSQLKMPDHLQKWFPLAKELSKAASNQKKNE